MEGVEFENGAKGGGVWGPTGMGFLIFDIKMVGFVHSNGIIDRLDA